MSYGPVKPMARSPVPQAMHLNAPLPLAETPSRLRPSSFLPLQQTLTPHVVLPRPAVRHSRSIPPDVDPVALHLVVDKLALVPARGRKNVSCPSMTLGSIVMQGSMSLPIMYPAVRQGHRVVRAEAAQCRLAIMQQDMQLGGVHGTACTIGYRDTGCIAYAESQCK